MAQKFVLIKITKRSKPTNQAQTKITIAKGLKTHLNDLKDYPTTYQGFETSCDS